LRRLAFLLLSLVVLAGCNFGRYRERVERTRRYLDYRQRLSRHLSERAWRGNGITLRVPRQFHRVDEVGEGGQKPSGKRAKTQKPEPDATPPPPPPDVLRRLEGLRAVWSTTVETGEATDAEKQPAWLAVASNRHLWEQGHMTRQEALRFERRIVEVLFRSAGQSPPSRREWTAVSFPEKGEFTRAKVFHPFTIPLTARQGLPGRYETLLYVHTRGSVQVAILFLLPHDVAASERLTEAERIGLCLETLEVAGL